MRHIHSTIPVELYWGAHTDASSQFVLVVVTDAVLFATAWPKGAVMTEDVLCMGM